MENNSHIILSQDDFQKISALISGIRTDLADALEEELSRASIVRPEQLPHDVVSMNSKLKFIDLDSQKEMIVTLVYPHEADVKQNKISILAPVGSALIGLRVGQIINWPVPNGNEKKFKIGEILYQQRID